jgi:hypothetical protein
VRMFCDHRQTVKLLIIDGTPIDAGLQQTPGLSYDRMLWQQSKTARKDRTRAFHSGSLTILQTFSTIIMIEFSGIY